MTPDGGLMIIGRGCPWTNGCSPMLQGPAEQLNTSTCELEHTKTDLALAVLPWRHRWQLRPLLAGTKKSHWNRCPSSSTRKADHRTQTVDQRRETRCTATSTNHSEHWWEQSATHLI